MLSAEESIQRLMEGNQRFRERGVKSGDVSRGIREKTAREGQNPYAIIITCSDARVIPGAIFSAGIGDLFVIRVAGNVIDDHQLGSIEYAADHLGTKLILVLGHTKCGAVDAAIEGHTDGFIGTIIKDIKMAIGDEKDDYRASCLNVKHGIAMIRHELRIHPIHDEKGLKVMGAIYDIETGEVTMLE